MESYIIIKYSETLKPELRSINADYWRTGGIITKTLTHGMPNMVMHAEVKV